MNSVTFRIGTVVCLCIKRVIPLLCLSLAWLLAAVPAFSQGNTGRIMGAVSDQNGGNVVGAAVTITDVQRGITRSLVTGEGGEYVAGDLLPGTYKVRVEVKGFKIFERQNILLEVGKDVRIDVMLQPGSVSETITITEEVPMVDTTTTTLGGTISNEIINDLPLNGRNYQNLLTLRPGTSIYPGGGPWTQTTNGIRPEDTSYIVDGITNDEAFMGFSVTNAAAVLGDAATVIPIDAIQEFNTQVNPKAEFGWKPGAITSVGLKSGTNTLHGSAYAFGRSDSFDARNYFNHFNSDGTIAAKTPLELEQYGGTVGGHIIKDKLFYFGGYEGRRYTVGNSLAGSVPTTAHVAVPGATNGCALLVTGDCKHSIPDATADLVAQNPAFVVNPLSQYLLSLYTPNATQGTGVTLNFPNADSSKNALGKVDYHISDHHSLSGSYFFGNDTIIGMDSNELLAQFRTQVHSRAQDVSGHWAWTPSSSWANELRGGFTHYVLTIIPADVSFPYKITTGISTPILHGIPNIKLGGGFTELGAFHNFPKIVGPDKVYDFVDQISYLRGKHAFKFGGELRRDLVHQGTFRGGRGRITFGNLEALIAGKPTSAGLQAGDPLRDLSQWLYAGYLQDDWRIKPRVTLNLGLRYEYQAVPTEAHNLLGNFEPSVGLEQVGKNISSLYKPDHRNFSPRFGVAWDVTGKGTTVIRAGGSIIYDLLSMSAFMTQQNLQSGPVLYGAGVIPTGATIVTCPAGTAVAPACSGPGGTGTPLVTPGIGTILSTGVTLAGSGPAGLNWVDQNTAIYPPGVTGLVQCGDGVTPPATLAKPNPAPDPGPCSTFAMNRNFRTPYVENWTLGIQHAFSSKVSLDVSYVGNHGTKLPGVIDLNQPSPGGPLPLSQFPYLGFVNSLTNIYGSTYHGLQATFTGRNFHGLDFVAGYTYSHALDDLSSNWVGYLPMDSMRPFLEHASGDEDIRHRFTLSLTYTLPQKKMRGQLLEGWQVNSIITMQTGQPWNVNDQVNNFSNIGEASDRWDFFGNPSDFESGGPNTLLFCANPGHNGCSYLTQGGLFPVFLSDAQTAAFFASCQAKAPDQSTLTAAGCYVSLNGRSVLVPNAHNAFGTMGRNIFRDTGFHNIDLSVSKDFKFGERLKAQFRVEMFNAFNHPEFANPFGAASTYGQGTFSDPSVTSQFGCGCATPDNAAFNPVLGSGSNRAIQLGLKFLF